MSRVGKTTGVTRRFVLGALLGGVAGQVMANAPLTSMRPIPRGGTALVPGKSAVPSLDEIISQSQLSGEISFVVADARTGEILESRAPLKELPPASVTKSITALYALDVLGTGHKFRTRLVATGPIAGDRIDGDLVLVGEGDPTLDTDALGDLAARLREKGIRRISGNFLVYSNGIPSIDSIDPDHPVHAGYNPAVSGLNLNYNRVHFEWKRQSSGYAVSMDARARRYNPAVSVVNMRVVDRALPVYTYASSGGQDEWTVARRALGQDGSRWLPVRKPELYVADVFQTLARAQGIPLPRPRIATQLPKGKVLFEHRSEELREIMRDMLKWSTNLTAEVAGLAASSVKGVRARTLRASANEMTTWARRELGTSKARFVDHSGLGDASRISSSDMVKALTKVHPRGTLASLLKTIPIRTAKGEVIEKHPVKVVAKTGTLNFVSSLAGYITATDGRKLAFAIFTADMPRRAKITAADGDMPEGTALWNRRSKRVQMELLKRWGTAYTA